MVEVILSGDQADLLKQFAEAYARPVASGQKRTIFFYTAGGMAAPKAEHPSLPDGGSVEFSVGDLHELEDCGLVSVSWENAGSGSLRVTNSGYEAVNQVEKHDSAVASQPVVPTEGEQMGLDWEADVYPVLQAVCDLYSHATSSRGVTQVAINHRLGRDEHSPHTDLAFRKLEEAGYVKGVVRTARSDGPMSCEPAAKSLELLAGWPTDRGDTVLIRLLAALETRIDQTPDAVEKGKLQRLLTAIQETGQGVMVGVLTNVITGGG